MRLGSTKSKIDSTEKSTRVRVFSALSHVRRVGAKHEQETERQSDQCVRHRGQGRDFNVGHHAEHDQYNVEREHEAQTPDNLLRNANERNHGGKERKNNTGMKNFRGNEICGAW